MKNGLLEFLYGASQRREEVDDIIDSDLARLIEEAAEEEGQEMAANKTSLVDALKGVGITPGEIREESGYQCFETDDREEYFAACRVLNDPDTMHKLAEKGWVAEKCGDVAMSQEKPCFKIKFLDIAVAEASDDDKGPDQEEILKKAQAFASTEVDTDDPMNPVEHPSAKMGGGRKGVGEPSDGEKPKGTIKDSLEAGDIVSSMLDLSEARVLSPEEIPQVEREFQICLSPYCQNAGATLVRLSSSIAAIKNGQVLQHRGPQNRPPPEKDVMELRQFLGGLGGRGGGPQQSFAENCGQPGSRLKKPKEGTKPTMAKKPGKKK
jgi:hypothetical protein